MRRVAYLTPLYFDEKSYLGGGERYPLNLARALVATGGYEVDLVSYGDNEKLVDAALADGVRLRVLPTATRHGSERLSWDVLAAIRAVDVVHLHQIFSRQAEVGMLVAKLLGKPVCAHDHGGTMSTVGRSLGLLELADRITVSSEFGRSLFHTGTPIEMIMGGVDDTYFTPPSAPAPPRDRVVFVGRVMPHKGIDRLITALPPDVPLSICGRAHDEGYLGVLRRLAAGKQVEIHDDLDDRGIRDMYRRALAVVLPSVYVDFYSVAQPWPELMGFALLEGSASGAPVLCSRVGGMPEYVEHGVTGYVFDSLEQLRGHLDHLAHDPQDVARLGQAGRRLVEQRFGLAASGAALHAMYDDVLAAALA